MIDAADPRVPVRFTRPLGYCHRARAASWAMIGQDGGQSIDLGDRTLFVFSDTLLAVPNDAGAREGARPPFQLATDEPCVFLANCAATSTGRGAREAFAEMRFYHDADGCPVEILTPTPEERAARIRFWPEHGILVDGTVYLYYVGVQTIDPTTPWGFRNLGVGIAALDPASGACRRVRRDGEWRLWRMAADDFHLGVQTIREGDDVYVFGSVRREHVVRGIVARAPAARLGDPSAYVFRRDESDGWTADLTQAGGVGLAGSNYSVSYNRYLGGYLMVYIDSYTKELIVRLAPRITGPYSPPQSLGRVPHRSTSELVYLGFEHPQFAADGGRRVYVSYCQPHFTLSSLVELCFR